MTAGVRRRLAEAQEVLVVEDEPLVRMLAVEVLRDSGFQVVEADNGEAALRFLESYPHIVAVFSDVNMPGPIDGFELARRARRRRPDIGIVLTSGRFLPDAKTLDLEGARLLPKPYSFMAIAGIIGGVIAQGQWA